MSRLEDALYYVACARLQNNRRLAQIEFVISGATVPGEGEVGDGCSLGSWFMYIYVRVLHVCGCIYI